MSEISLRIYHKVRYDIPFWTSPLTFYDKELGWKGKKVFGNIWSTKPKIFFVGDSGTHGYGAEESIMYYNVIRKTLDAEVFAYGAPGYGTLQEYLVIDKYLDEIKPDLVILQVSTNDFINNSWELESAQVYHNLLMVRPYLINGIIEHHFPKSWGRLRMTLSVYSRLFYSLSNRLDILFAILASRGKSKTVEVIIGEKGMNFEPFRKSVIVTNILVEKIKKRMGGVPIIAFSYDSREPYVGQFREIFKANGIDFIESAYKATEEAEAQGKNVRLTKGGYFNALGSRIVGKVLAGEIKKKLIAKNKLKKHE